MKTILTLIIILLLISCNTAEIRNDQEETNNMDNDTPAFTVEFSGALKNMMHKGDVSAYADLSDFEQIEHLYALGAVEGLKGEILVLDGTPYISSEQDGQLQIDNTYDYKASLLVNTTVSEWDEYKIDDHVTSYEALESFIAQTAKQNGINISEPFPFRITGIADTIHWHVINWPDGDTEHSHEKHIHSGLYGVHTDIDAEILGFYSDSHHAIFTHHTTNMHLHFINEDKSKTGHVDGLTLKPGMTLMLPKLK